MPFTLSFDSCFGNENLILIKYINNSVFIILLIFSGSKSDSTFQSLKFHFQESYFTFHWPVIFYPVKCVKKIYFKIFFQVYLVSIIATGHELICLKLFAIWVFLDSLHFLAETSSLKACQPKSNKNVIFS